MIYEPPKDEEGRCGVCNELLIDVAGNVAWVLPCKHPFHPACLWYALASSEFRPIIHAPPNRTDSGTSGP